jgi:hypothetical protein
MKRREFITLLGGVAAWPLAARAQQGDRMRRVGVLSNPGSDDAEMQSRTAAFVQGSQELGWTVGRNLQIDYRWSNGDAERLRSHALELVALKPTLCWPRPASRSCCSCRPTAAFQSYLRRRSIPLAWCRRKLIAAGRQQHWIYPIRIQHSREMAGVAQRDRAGHDASGRPA